jgi:type VI secretion system protein ImpH
MPATKRRLPATVIRRLIDRPQQFQFFQAVRMIDLMLRRDEQAQRPTLERVLRCKNSVSLRFPLSQIEALSTDAEVPVGTDSELHAALDQGQLRHIHLTPAFMGLLGVSGVLPYCYTDTIAAQIHFDKDESGRAFLDSFTHRSMMLFYRAWEKSHIEYRHDSKGKDGFLPLQLALAGAAARLATPHQPKRDAATVADEVVAHYAALIRHRPVSGEVIAAVLSEYFGLPFRLEQFVGAWETLRPEERAHAGKTNCQLGRNMNLGPRYWRRDLCVRLWIGPLSRTQFDQFLPDGDSAPALRAMLALFAVPNIRFEVHLILRARDIAPVKLNFSSKLGRGSFLAGKPTTIDQDKAHDNIQF